MDERIYRVLMRRVEKGAAGVEGDIDVLKALGKLTDEQYKTLISRLHPEGGGES